MGQHKKRNSQIGEQNFALILGTKSELGISTHVVAVMAQATLVQQKARQYDGDAESVVRDLLTVAPENTVVRHPIPESWGEAYNFGLAVTNLCVEHGLPQERADVNGMGAMQYAMQEMKNGVEVREVFPGITLASRLLDAR